MATEKIRITDVFATITTSYSVKELRDLCDNALNSPDWINCYLDSDSDEYNTEIYIKGERLETDKEYKRRISEEQRYKLAKQKHKADAEAYERLQYERLKKKFEGT